MWSQQSQICDILLYFHLLLKPSGGKKKKPKNCAAVWRMFIICTKCAWFLSRSTVFHTAEPHQGHTFSSRRHTKTTGPLEMLMPVTIQEFHAKSTFNKPFLRPHKNPLQSALTVFSERQAWFPQCTLGNVCVLTSWPRKKRFRAPVKTLSLFVLRCSGSLKGSRAPCSRYWPVPDLKDNHYAHTSISRHAEILIILCIAGLLGFTGGAITSMDVTFQTCFAWLKVPQTLNLG